MKEAYIRDRILRKKKLFRDESSAWRDFSMQIYRGYVGLDFFGQEHLPSEMSYYQNMFLEEEYDHTGSKVDKHRKKKTINMAHLTANLMRTHVLSGGYTLHVENDEKGKKKKFLDKVLDKNNFKRNEGDLLEYSLVTGDNIKLVSIVDGEIHISFIKGNRFLVTSHVNGNVKSFIAVTTKKEERQGKFGQYKTYYITLLEHHRIENDTYQIKREIYESDEVKNENAKKERYHLKNKLAFGRYAVMFGLKEGKEAELFNLDEPMFVYTKMPFTNNKDADSVRGIGMFVNAIDTMQTINNAFDADDLETEDAKIKTIVPEWMLEASIKENDQMVKHYNKRTRTFVSVADEQGMMNEPKTFAPAMRDVSYTNKIQRNMAIFAQQCKISPSTFTFDKQTQQTATEVKLEHARTHRTRDEIVDILQEKWKELVWIIYKYAKHYKLIDFQLEKEDLKFTIHDSTITDREVIENIKESVNAGLISLQKAQEKYREYLKEPLDEKDAEIVYYNIMQEQGVPFTQSQSLRYEQLLANKRGEEPREEDMVVATEVEE